MVVSSAAPNQDSFLGALREAEKNKIAPQLDSLYDNILECLEVVNRHLNPPDNVRGTEQIDRSLLNAMSYLLHRAWQHQHQWRVTRTFPEEVTNHLYRIAWRISCAWCAILDGDITSLKEHVPLEEQATILQD
jgi:flagellin-specific chaperone FliS